MNGFDYAALERRVAALEANRGASLRFGTIVGVDAARGTARVRLDDGDDMVTAPLRVLASRTLKDKVQCLPDIEEPVACLFSGQGMEAGVVLGAHYSDKTPSPGQEATEDYRRYEDGTELWYDRKAHKLRGIVKGDVELEVEGAIKAKAEQGIDLESAAYIRLKAPHVYIWGAFHGADMDGKPGTAEFSGDMAVRNGGISVPDKDVQAGEVSLRGHQHENSGGSGVGGKPVGG